MFERPGFLYLLIAVPFLVALFVVDIFIYKKRAKIIAGNNVDTILPYYTEGQKWVRTVLYAVGFILVVCALARPKWGEESVKTTLKGRDIIVLLDVSYSMAVPDVVPSRIELAKKYIQELLDSGIEDRVGLMIFSSDTELLVPATYDYAAVSFFLESIFPGMLGQGGTDIGNALVKSIQAFDDADYTNKMVILMTDGEDLENNFKPNLDTIRNSGIKIFTVGVGTKNGEPVPLKNASGDVESYVKDQNGNHVVSRLDEKYLSDIADATGAAYMRTSGESGELVKFVKEITGLKKKAYNNLPMKQKKDRYVLFLGPALILFCLGFILDFGKLWRRDRNVLGRLFVAKFFIISIMLIAFALPLAAQQLPVPGQTQTKKTQSEPEKKDLLSSKLRSKNGAFWGNSAFDKEEYSKALSKYSSSLYSFEGNDLGKLYFNIANTFVKTKDTKNAEKYYGMAAEKATDPLLQADIHYNEGLVKFANKEYGGAAVAFKEALKNNDADDDARFNYEIAKLFADQQNKDQQDKDKKDNQEKGTQKESESNKDQDSAKNQDMDKMLEALEQKEKENSRKDAYDKASKTTTRGMYW